MKERIAYPFVVLALWGVALVADPSPVSHADGSAQFEFAPSREVSPDTADSAEQERLVSKLYAHYADCLNRLGSDEACYRRWRQECQAHLREKCDVLEEQMFPDPRSGDESC